MEHQDNQSEDDPNAKELENMKQVLFAKCRLRPLLVVDDSFPALLTEQGQCQAGRLSKADTTHKKSLHFIKRNATNHISNDSNVCV
uniref:Uncharacterized protein n=1 Tax=Solanum tuberosum TaxID=4113 RepID=M0ZGJ8_SOLTU